MEKIVFSQDQYNMNWLREDYKYAEVNCPKDVACKTEFRSEGDLYYTTVFLTNTGSKPLFTSVDSIGIRFPLEDRYECSEVCITRRCNAHIFCGGNVSYIMALRMGGAAPHLGMGLTEGSLECYSVERELDRQSNDRGCFVLHPSPMSLLPGETQRISWVVFPHEGKEDFHRRLGDYTKYVKVEAERYVVFRGERILLRIQPAFAARKVLVEDRELEMSPDGTYLLEYMAGKCGEQVFRISADGVRTWCRILVKEPLQELAGKRCRFLEQKQQYKGKIAGLCGSYLIYDNEEQHIFYNAENDYNGGRERVGMGLLMAEYLRTDWLNVQERAALENSLERYMAYVQRELVDSGTGEVFNDFGRDNSYERLYNYTWFAALFLEWYGLTGRREDLETAYRILEAFYRRGGAGFYPIELPALRLDSALREAGMEKERQSVREWFCRHAGFIARTGLNYPPSEVNFEQSIVAPAADILLQVCLLTGDEKFLEAGRKQLKVLEQFNGTAPDYHLYEVAVRHWDGYWFGKRRLYGDTFPHYWSALTGNVYELYSRATGEAAYRKKAWDSIRGVLPLFSEDGSASCAYVYPYSVNGKKAGFFDPYANDQDWGLYFALRLERELQKAERR